MFIYWPAKGWWHSGVNKLRGHRCTADMEVAPKQFRRKFSIIPGQDIISPPYGSIQAEPQAKGISVGIAVCDCASMCPGGLAIKLNEGYLITGQNEDYYSVKSLTKIHVTGLVPKHCLQISSTDKPPRSKVNSMIPPRVSSKLKSNLRPDGGRGSLQVKYLPTLNFFNDKPPITIVPTRFIDTSAGRIVEFRTLTNPIFRSVAEVFYLFEKLSELCPGAIDGIPPQTFENLNESLDEIECFVTDIISLGKDSSALSHLLDFAKERPSDSEIRERSLSAPTLSQLPLSRLYPDCENTTSPRDSFATSLSYFPRIKIKLEYTQHLYAFWLQTPSYTALLDHLISRIGLPPIDVWYLNPSTKKNIPLASQNDFMAALDMEPKSIRVIVAEIK